MKRPSRLRCQDRSPTSQRAAALSGRRRVIAWLISTAAGCRWMATARAVEWPDEYRCGQFHCHADFPLAPQTPFLHSLPSLQHALVEALGVQPSQETIHLLLFAREATYRDYLREYFPEVPARKAMFIKQRGPGMVFAWQGSAFETDLRHECTHALLHAALPMVPLWLDEGLAEYFEVPAADRRAGNPHLKYVRLAALASQVPSLEGLEAIGDVRDMSRGKYRSAWAWVHFLLHGPPVATAELRRYLADIQSLTPPGVLSRRLLASLPDLQTRFAAHFRSWHA